MRQITLVEFNEHNQDATLKLPNGEELDVEIFVDTERTDIPGTMTIVIYLVRDGSISFNDRILSILMDDRPSQDR